jgi:hypothetical protein
VNNLSNTPTSTINVTAVNDTPVLTAGGTLNYTENQAATAIVGTITATDVDSPNLVGGTVTINPPNYVNGQDVLSYVMALGITGTFNASTGTLTLTGTTTVANYQTALRNVLYANTSNDPSTLSRTITWQVNDGGAANNLSNTATSTITVTAFNDPPTATSRTNPPAQAAIPITYPGRHAGRHRRRSRYDDHDQHHAGQRHRRECDDQRRRQLHLHPVAQHGRRQRVLHEPRRRQRLARTR